MNDTSNGAPPAADPSPAPGPAPAAPPPDAKPPPKQPPPPEIPLSKLPSGFLAVVPRTFEECYRLATMLSKSAMVPKDFRGAPENCMVAIMWGLELGLSALQAVQNIAVINGRPSLWGDLVIAIVQQHPDYEWHREEPIDADGNVVDGLSDCGANVEEQEVYGYRCTVKRRNRAEHVAVFTIGDALKAGLWTKAQTPWITYPKRMLQMRARGFAVRDTFADALRGMGYAEESIDLPPSEYSVVETGKAVEPIRTPTRRAEQDTPADPPAEQAAPPALEHQPPDDLLAGITVGQVGESLERVVEAVGRSVSDLGDLHRDIPAEDRAPAPKGAGARARGARPAPEPSGAPSTKRPLSQGMRALLDDALAACQRTTTEQDLLDELGDNVHAGNINRALSWLKARPRGDA